MEIVKRIEEKLNKVFIFLDQKDKELDEARQATRALYKELLKVKKYHEQENDKCS